MKIYRRIIFVADAGTCRAPMAAALLKEYTLKHPVEVLARGLVVLFQEPLNQKAEAVMISNGVSTEGYVSTQLSDEDVDEDTLVLTMERSQCQKVLDICANAKEENVCVLTELVGEELEIMNPYGGTLQSYGLCFETLRQTIKKLVKLLNENEGE